MSSLNSYVITVERDFISKYAVAFTSVLQSFQSWFLPLCICVIKCDCSSVRLVSSIEAETIKTIFFFNYDSKRQVCCTRTRHENQNTLHFQIPRSSYYHESGNVVVRLSKYSNMITRFINKNIKNTNILYFILVSDRLWVDNKIWFGFILIS